MHISVEGWTENPLPLYCCLFVPVLCQIQESSKNLVRTWLNTFWAPTGRAVDQSYQLCRLFQPAVVVAEGEAGGEIDQNGELREKISPCAFVPVSACRGTCFRAEFFLKNIWNCIVNGQWSWMAYSGDKWRCYRYMTDRRTSKRRWNYSVIKHYWGLSFTKNQLWNNQIHQWLPKYLSAFTVLLSGSLLKATLLYWRRQPWWIWPWWCFSGKKTLFTIMVPMEMLEADLETEQHSFESLLMSPASTNGGTMASKTNRKWLLMRNVLDIRFPITELERYQQCAIMLEDHSNLKICQKWTLLITLEINSQILEDAQAG